MMKEFYKTYKLPIWIALIGVPLVYCQIMFAARAAAVAGCHLSAVYDGSYDSRVYCNHKADALTWGRKGDFEGMGKVWTWDDHAEIYIIRGQMK